MSSNKRDNKRKQNRAFTLIELLGVIILLSVISIIAIVSVGKNIKDTKRTLSQIQLNNIKDGAKNWSTDNIKSIPNGKTIYLTLAQLKQGGYVDENIKSPDNDKYCFPNDLQIEIKSNESGSYEYNVLDNNIEYIPCEDDELDKNNPSIVLTKDSNSTINSKNEVVDYVEADLNNHAYQVLGYSFYENDGSRIDVDNYNSDYEISITIDGTTVPSDKINNITVDISQYNKTYKIVYKITQDNKEFAAIRNVIVQDTTFPVINSDNKIWKIGDSSAPVIANDNGSGIVAYQCTISDNITANSNGWTSLTSPVIQTEQTCLVPNGGDGYYIYVKDGAGNITKKYVTVIEDNDAPTLTLSISNGTTYTKSKTAIVTIGDIGVSGLSDVGVKVYYAWGTSNQACDDMTESIMLNPTEGSNSVTGEITINSISGAGKLYICNKDAAITDRAGNSLEIKTTKSVDMYLDNQAPQLVLQDEDKLFTVEHTEKEYTFSFSIKLGAKQTNVSVTSTNPWTRCSNVSIGDVTPRIIYIGILNGETELSDISNNGQIIVTAPSDYYSWKLDSGNTKVAYANQILNLKRSGGKEIFYGPSLKNGLTTISIPFKTMSAFDTFIIKPQYGSTEDSFCMSNSYNNVKLGETCLNVQGGEPTYVMSGTTPVINNCAAGNVLLNSCENEIYACHTGNGKGPDLVASNVPGETSIQFTVNFSDAHSGGVTISYDNNTYSDGTSGTCSADTGSSCYIYAKDSADNVTRVRCSNTGNYATSACEVDNL